VLSELARALGADVHDLGFDAREPGLRAVAAALVELGVAEETRG
jgi:hypothetical protein